MSLEDFFDNEELAESQINSVQTLSEKIKQRRIQMLVHSYLYYHLDSPVIEDLKWTEWAQELESLQVQKKEIDFYDKEFKDWDGHTGMHLPIDQNVLNWTRRVLDLKGFRYDC